MAMLQHSFNLQRLLFTSSPHFRHVCQLSSYVACQRFDQDSKRTFPCHRHCNHAVPFSQRSVVGLKSAVHNQSISGLSGLHVQFKTLKLIAKEGQIQSNCYSGGRHLHAWINPCANQANFFPMKNIINRTMISGNTLDYKHAEGLSCGHQRRTLYTSSVNYDPSPSKAGITKLLEDEEKKSKVEEAVEAMKEKKEKLKEKAFQMECSPEEIEPIVTVSPPPKKSLWQRVKQEAAHYYSGFKLLYLEVRIAARMLWQVMNGRVLSRRERRQFLRTVADIFRLVPFLVFVLIPFMEFMLPVAVYLFPNMLPSTFVDKSKKEESKKKQLKVKIQMAKFLQDTVEEMAVAAKEKKTQEVVADFANFFEKIRSKGQQPSNEDILRFSKLFEDQITLDNMSRAQLKAINRLLMLPTIGTNNYFRFRLRMKLRELRADDLLIQREGVESLTEQELQSASQARGMRAIGVPAARLRSQLKQWVELHLDEQIPASLLLMSRALYLPENISKVDQLKETLSQLPENLVEEAEIKICEVSGEKVDNKVRLDVLQNEERMIAEENQELLKEEEEKKKKIESIASEILEDKAPDIKPMPEEDISQDDWLSIKVSLARANERDELEKIKEDREEYQEELRELKTEDEKRVLEESLGSSRLGRKVDVMIKKIEDRLRQVEDEIEQPLDADGDGKISLQEMISAVQRLKDAPSEAKCKRIAEMLDEDHDGALDLEDVGTVAELLSLEDVDLTPDQIKDVIVLLEKENKLRKADDEEQSNKISERAE
ncbi:mitochondrial proton/calcium exchanger protein-like [Stylophora pistillata]|uniref:Mitochondrial proton/calcium exchanger protein n=1 Tax=Stylophora pistillata TaxID=50429 RepID=A0A2B4SIL2_STYPI|nr:mitochondrial proton/calcium exchanger protein-like [Stylophora pistillata]PFX29216.1 LETM1 and EF-hand domain-containing protein 1, mitochondrial [Stylophora pistillata]